MSDTLLYGFKLGELVLVAYTASESPLPLAMAWKNVPEVGVHFYDRQLHAWIKSGHNWGSLEDHVLSRTDLYRTEYFSKTEWHLDHTGQY